MLNRRPGGIFGDMDYGWQGTTLNERIQAQNIYDVGVAVEENNRLIQEVLKKSKEPKQVVQQPIIVEENKSDKELERKIQLCDWQKMDYDDITKFVKVLNTASARLAEILKTKFSEYMLLLTADKQPEAELKKREIEKLSKEVDINIAEKKEQFNTFRLNHYNAEVELLFQKLGLDIPQLEIDDIKDYGTSEDYNKFISQLIIKEG